MSQAVASPQTPRLNPNARVFIVEGEIAAGKTELVRALATRLRQRGLKVRTVLEPVYRWRQVGILKKFYGAPQRHAYGFQTYVYATRVQEIVNAVKAEPDSDIYLLERSPATDQIFMELQRDQADPVEMDMYETWCDTFNLMLPIDLAKAQVLYLKTSLDQCMSRLSARARDGEIVADSTSRKDASASGGVSLEYQKRLRRAHEAFFLGKHRDEFPHMHESPFPHNSITEIGPELADGNFRDPGDERDRIVDRIITLMKI